MLAQSKSQSLAKKQAEEYRKLIRREAEIGGKIFGPVPKGHRREFFCLDEHSWVWHEEWIDKSGIKQLRNTRYDVRPSGIVKVHNGRGYTAISLAQDIIGNHPNYSSWSLDKQLSSETLPIYSERKDPVVGIHQINYNSTIDTLEIKHTAHNRDGYALGAVLAAEFLIGKRGNFTMRDVLGLNSI